MGSTVHIYTSKTVELFVWFLTVLYDTDIIEVMLNEFIQTCCNRSLPGYNTEVMSAKSRYLAAGQSMDRKPPNPEGHHRTMTLF